MRCSSCSITTSAEKPRVRQTRSRTCWDARRVGSTLSWKKTKAASEARPQAPEGIPGPQCRTRRICPKLLRRICQPKESERRSGRLCAGICEHGADVPPGAEGAIEYVAAL